jgi:hypothetical protein
VRLRAAAFVVLAAAAVIAAFVMRGDAVEKRGARPGTPISSPAAPASQAPRGSEVAPTWSLSPRRHSPDAPSLPPQAAAVLQDAAPAVPFTPENLPERVRQLVRQGNALAPGQAYELFSLLNECAVAPQRLAISAGCVSGGDCAPPPQRMARYQDTIAACREIPADLVARRNQYLDMAAAQGDTRAQNLRAQQPR